MPLLLLLLKPRLLLVLVLSWLLPLPLCRLLPVALWLLLLLPLPMWLLLLALPGLTLLLSRRVLLLLSLLWLLPCEGIHGSCHTAAGCYSCHHGPQLGSVVVIDTGYDAQRLEPLHKAAQLGTAAVL